MASPVTFARAVALGWLLVSGAACADKTEKEQPAVTTIAGLASLTAIPGDATAVGGIDLSAIVASDLWQTYGTFIESRFESELDEFQRVCAMDPMRTVDSLVAGGNLDEHDGVVVVTGIPRAQVEACSQELARSRGEKLEIVPHGRITRTEDANGSQMHFGWLDDVTMVIASKGQDRARVEALLASDGGLAGNHEMIELLSKVDTSATLWGVVRNTTGRAMGSLDRSSDSTSKISGTDRGTGSIDDSIDAVAVYVTVRLEEKGTRVSLDLGLRQDSADKAREVGEALERYKKRLLGTRRGTTSSPGAKKSASQGGGNASGETLDGLLDSRLTIEADGLDVRIQLTLTVDEIQELAQWIQRDPGMQKAIEHFVP